MPREFQDFDRFTAEEEPLRFRIAGKDYEISADLPASVVLELRRRQIDESDEAAMEALGTGIIKKVLGADEWDRIVENTGAKALNRFVSWLVEELMGAAEDEATGDEAAEDGIGAADPKEATGTPEAEALPSTTSLGTGGPSSQTSNVIGLYPPESSAV